MNEKIHIEEVRDSSEVESFKFSDPDVTAAGEQRAAVDPRQLETLWINTGSLCNLTCENCYIESSPTNDRLVYISLQEVVDLLDEIERENMGTREVAFTGGEPFLNPDMVPILKACLDRDFEVLVLTNGMKTLLREKDSLEILHQKFSTRLKLRISLDHYKEATHALERGPRSWKPAIKSLQWLSKSGMAFAVAGRTMWNEDEDSMRAGYGEMFTREGIQLDADDPEQLILFPEMDESADVPEITTSCWSILDKNPADIMCASSRMVVKHKGDDHLSIQACTLLPYDQRFNLGRTLKESWHSVKLNHPHCAKFCVLGSGRCSA
ncbi:MAG: radical SAM protein [Gammaproteobacteria bacterium]|nr:radical SAM protein [Gammaproteobacteria bacterium]